MERREREEACLVLDEGGELLVSRNDLTGAGGGGRARLLQVERTTKAEGRAGCGGPAEGGVV